MSDPDLLMDPVARFEEANPTAVAKIAAEMTGEANAEAENVAYRRRRDAIREARGQAEFAKQRYEASNNINEKTKGRLQKEIDKLKRDEERNESEYQRTYKGHAMNTLREFFAKAPNVNARYVPADTEGEYIKGKTTPAEMCKHWLDTRLTNERDLDATKAAPFTAAELRPVIADGVTALSASLRQTVSTIRRPEFIERTKTFRPGKLRLPEVTVADGLGGVTKFPDATALLCEVFRDQIVDHLVKLAETEFSNDDGIDLAERNRRVATLTAEIEHAEYQIEYWARECRSIGQNPPARSSNPLAILDLRRVR